jgi:hypothetical protein
MRDLQQINRYAKPTARSDNLLTSEDDGYAIVTRRLPDPENEDAPLAEREMDDEEERVGRYELVQWYSSALSRTMRHLTTIGEVNSNVRSILGSWTPRRPRPDNQAAGIRAARLRRGCSVVRHAPGQTRRVPVRPRRPGPHQGQPLSKSITRICCSSGRSARSPLSGGSPAP